MEEELKSQTSKITEVLDYNLFSTYIAGGYLDFHETFNTFSCLNRQFRSFLGGDREFLWKKFFEQEFLRLEFPDHKKNSSETYFAYFRRSFVDYYKRMRYLLRGIIYETNERSHEVYK